MLPAAILRSGYFGNFYRRVTYLAKKGDVTLGHKHNFHHTMLVYEGDVRVEATTPDGRKLDRIFGRSSPWGVTAIIHKDVEHKITALCDETLYFCDYSIRNKDGSVSEEITGFAEAFD